LTLHELHPEVLAFSRQSGEDRLLVLANLGDQPATMDATSCGATDEVLAHTGLSRRGLTASALRLEPRAGAVLRAKAPG